MTKIVPEVQAPLQEAGLIGECPHCGSRATGFEINAASRVDATITLKPCGCASHSSDGYFKQFSDLIKGSGSL